VLLHEADVSTKSAATRQDARLPRANGDQGRAEGAGAPACEGAETADRLTGRLPRGQRLTASAEFQALFQQGKRVDRPALIVLYRDVPDTTRVGFAVSRKLGNAVQRNRARRRLREAYRVARPSAPLHAALDIIGRPAVLTAPFPVLVDQLRQALAAVPGARTLA
jgi:ribonuclease P protein component